MIEIEIRGFQSIEHVKFRVENFTVLVGRSNIGKSAIVRAIQCALTGASGTDFVRHGSDCDRRQRGIKKCKCFSQVIIKTSAAQITWEKGDAVNRYIVLKAGERETTVYDKTGRGVPEFLQPDFSPVKVGDTMSLVQVSDQFDPIFLLNQSGPAVADVLSDVARLDQINGATRLVEKDRKSDSATRKVREKDVVAVSKSLEAYEGLDAVLDDVAQVEQRHEALRQASDALDELDGFLDRAKNLSASLRALKAAVTPPLPDGKALDRASRQAALVGGFLTSLSAKAKLVRHLRGVGDIALPDRAPIEGSLGQARQIETWIRQLRSFKTRLERWKDVSKYTLPDPEDVKTSRATIDEMQKFLTRLSKLQASQKRVEALLEAAEAQEQEALEEIQKLGVCPTCSQRIEAGRCLHLEGP